MKKPRKLTALTALDPHVPFVPLVTVIVLLLLLSGSQIAAAQVTLKIATLAPDGSPWHKRLVEMGIEWSEITDRRVVLRIYPGGVAGDDPDMVRKMRIGQLQGTVLTVAGLVDIERGFHVFSIPLFFDSYEEYLYVRGKLAPVFESRLEAKGYRLVHWVHGGWVHFFSQTPVRTVDDLKRTKMFTWAGDDRMVGYWRESGFRPVPLAATDIMIGLQTGMIDALPATPLAALSLQWFRHTPYMFEARIAPLVGAFVVSSKSWSTISESDRAALLESALRTQELLEVEIPEKDRSAIEEMKKRGLTVTGIEPGPDEEAWATTASVFARKMGQRLANDGILELARRYREEFREFRESHASGSPP